MSEGKDTSNEENPLKKLQKKVIHNNHLDKHSPVLLGLRNKPPGFYGVKPKFPKKK